MVCPLCGKVMWPSDKRDKALIPRTIMAMSLQTYFSITFSEPICSDCNGRIREFVSSIKKASEATDVPYTSVLESCIFEEVVEDAT